MIGILLRIRSRVLVASVLLALPVAALLAGQGRAAPAPPTVSKPVISGEAQEGRTLTASATWTGDPEPNVEWQWLRCAKAQGFCTSIPDATSSQRTVTGDDVGFLLRVRVRATNESGSDEARSEPTTVVTAAPSPEPTPSPSPSPDPDPDPSPSPSPDPSPSPSPDPSPSPSPSPLPDLHPVAPDATPAPMLATSGVSGAAVTPPVGGAAPSTAAAPRLLRPFPIVRIRGRLTPAGARVTLLTVRAPHGARITIRCRGRSCPGRRLARTARLTRIRRLERNLAAGTRLDVTVTRPDRIGKWTTIRIVRGAPPKRRDRCVLPGGKSPVACPVG
jgi:hypothetical protein